MKKLKDPCKHLGYFLERAKRLGSTLGPILVQLPPRWKRNSQRLEEFLDAVPRHCRWAVELRDTDWLCDEVYDLLRANNAALVIHDMIAGHPRIITAEWTYLRFHGQSYGGSYSDQKLAEVSSFIREQLSEGLDVYAYFNNDLEGYAVKNAFTLKKLLE